MRISNALRTFRARKCIASITQRRESEDHHLSSNAQKSSGGWWVFRGREWCIFKVRAFLSCIERVILARENDRKAVTQSLTKNQLYCARERSRLQDSKHNWETSRKTLHCCYVRRNQVELMLIHQIKKSSAIQTQQLFASALSLDVSFAPIGDYRTRFSLFGWDDTWKKVRNGSQKLVWHLRKNSRGFMKMPSHTRTYICTYTP